MTITCTMIGGKACFDDRSRLDVTIGEPRPHDNAAKPDQRDLRRINNAINRLDGIVRAKRLEADSPRS